MNEEGCPYFESCSNMYTLSCLENQFKRGGLTEEGFRLLQDLKNMESECSSPLFEYGCKERLTLEDETIDSDYTELDYSKLLSGEI